MSAEIQELEPTGNNQRSLPPVRHGDTYCSPWCGGRCKWADYVRRHEQTEELLALLGPGWTASVWENLGWYGEVVCGPVRIMVPAHGARDCYDIGLWNVARNTNPSRSTSDKSHIPSLIRECLAEVESSLADQIETLAPARAWANAPAALPQSKPEVE